MKKNTDCPKVVNITKVIAEAKDAKTFHFVLDDEVIPGQFFMVWIPDVDEIPMSCSYSNRNVKGITFCKVGEATNALYDLKVGDKLGIRGPYGNGFTISGKKILCVGGGTGIATLIFAVEHALYKKNEVYVIVGAQTKSKLLFVNRFKNMRVSGFSISTDDGSMGFKGFASTVAERIMGEHVFDVVLTCGPELMMKRIVDLCLKKNIPVQASLERYIKCGIGICGQCCIGEGLRVCKDGPVFDGETLKNINDFAFFKRDASGRKVRFLGTKNK